MFTAHITDDGFKKQTVTQHCINVSVLAQQYAECLHLVNTAKLQGLLHDMGKLSADFNDYIEGNSSYQRGDIDHAYAGAKFLHDLIFDKSNKIAEGYVSRTIISHHGLHDWIDADNKSYFDYRVGKIDRYTEIYNNRSIVFDDDDIFSLFKLSNDEIHTYINRMKDIVRVSLSKSEDKAEEFLFYSGLFERLLQSILVDADRTDTSFFMKTGITSVPSEELSDNKYLWECCSKRLDKKYEKFRKNPHGSSIILERRMKISNECLNFAQHDVGICRLIVPTGGGKTLSSLRFAIEYCKSHNKNQIFYIAPFMSILEQNSDVIKEIVGDVNFLEYYSDFAQSIDDKEELNKYEMRVSKWDTPVISTTFVQFLNTIFSGKMESVRRFHRLTNSVIIIDEVQAIPLKCVNLFNLAVNFLAKVCGSTIVLCTATQPALSKTDFPIIFDGMIDMNPDFNEDFNVFHRTDLISVCRVNQYSFEEAAEFCSEKFDENGNLLVVVNTKMSARNIYEILKQRYENDVCVIHLSTNMCPQHRKDTIKIIKDKLESNRPIICVTTQLIEAGVDISFKCVVRSLAGLDNAAQAAGRCNRNGEYDICQAYIINIRDEKLRNLPEIIHRQDAAISVIYRLDSADLLKVSVMDDYFSLFYHERSKEMLYEIKVDDNDTTLIDILSLNSQRNAKAGNNRVSLRIGTQLFKTAGEMFHAIDSCTEEVVVPYNDEARSLITKINSDINIFELSKILRSAQKYSVSVYQNQLNQLESDGYIYKINDVWILRQGYDSDGVGLNISDSKLPYFIDS